MRRVDRLSHHEAVAVLSKSDIFSSSGAELPRPGMAPRSLQTTVEILLEHLLCIPSSLHQLSPTSQSRGGGGKMGKRNRGEEEKWGGECGSFLSPSVLPTPPGDTLYPSPLPRCPFLTTGQLEATGNPGKRLSSLNCL